MLKKYAIMILVSAAFSGAIILPVFASDYEWSGESSGNGGGSGTGNGK